jgi:hypothetical protein
MKKRRNPIAADLMTPKYRKRIVQSKKIYRRKNRDNSKS